MSADATGADSRGLQPGQLELADWLEQASASGPAEWVDVMGGKVREVLSAEGLETTVRLLEQATAPSSPMFPQLTGPKARLLARAVSDSRAELNGAGDAWWVERFDAVIEVLNQWVRYKRIARKRTPSAEPHDRTLGDLTDAEEFYKNWVLKPFRENLRRVLEDRKISRKRFCEDLGISQAYLSQILRGIRSPSLSLISEVSRVLEIHIGRVFAVQHVATAAKGSTPEPGDTRRWYPGKVGRPYEALEAHYRMVFYPGPALPEEKIPARCHLVVDPEVRTPRPELQYLLRQSDGMLVVASWLGEQDSGGGMRFMGVMGETLVVGGTEGGPVNVGRVRGVLVEF